MGFETVHFNNMDGNRKTPNFTSVDPGGYYSVLNNSLLDSNSTGGILQETDTEIQMTIHKAVYTLVIILLSVVVLSAIVFVLFGLFMKANAFAHTDRDMSSSRRQSFIKDGFEFETQETIVFGRTGFGGFDE